MSSEKTHSVSVLALLPLRLSLGLSFLIAGQTKIASGNWGAAFETSLREFVVANLENTFSFYRPILESVVLNHSGKFAVLVSWGELMVGFSLFIGLFSRFGAAVGVFLMLNYMFAKGAQLWMPGLDSVYLWALVTLFICSPGRAFGLDQVLRSRKRIRLFT